MTTDRYIPALRFRSLTRLYDGVLRFTMRDEQFKSELVRQVDPRPGHRILDLGCGTATLSLLLKQACPAAAVVGLDGDREVLELARRKAQSAGVELELFHGLATEPPFEPGSFDRIVSSLLFHHLSTQAKAVALASARRLLAPDGELHVADWGRPHDVAMRVAFLGVQLLDGFETTRDNVEGRLGELMREAGFSSVIQTGRQRTLFGSLSMYRARA